MLIQKLINYMYITEIKNLCPQIIVELTKMWKLLHGM